MIGNKSLMKYIFIFLLIASLYGCSYTAGTAAKNIGNKVKKSCSALCLSTNGGSTATTSAEEVEPISVFTISVFERSGQILTW